MPAYIIVTRESPVSDPAAKAEYSASNRAHAEEWRAAYGVEPLVAYGTTETPEGAALDGVVVLKFPSMTSAKGWYECPAYQAVIPLREKAALWRVVMVDGV